MPRYAWFFSVTYRQTFTLDERKAITAFMGLDHLATKKDLKNFIDQAIDNQMRLMEDELSEQMQRTNDTE